MPGKIKTRAYLLKKQPYSENSIIIQAFSDSQGLISILAKGFHKKKEQELQLNALNEYDLVITNPPDSTLHVLVEISLVSEFPTDLPLENWFAAQAGAEILTKILLPLDEVASFYQALQAYLTYQRSITANPIAIFWRYLLHIYKLLGVPINLHVCSSCQQALDQPAGYSSVTGQLLCAKCLPLSGSAFSLQPSAGRILSLLPVIGNYINDLCITPQDIKAINHFLMYYFSRQFNRKLVLKSLQFFEQKQST